jgi:hypothetical protein
MGNERFFCQKQCSQIEAGKRGKLDTNWQALIKAGQQVQVNLSQQTRATVTYVIAFTYRHWHFNDVE